MPEAQIPLVQSEQWLCWRCESWWKPTGGRAALSSSGCGSSFEVGFLQNMHRFLERMWDFPASALGSGSMRYLA